MDYKIYYSCRSHVGKLRDTNQDNLFCDGKYIKDIEGQLSYSMNGFPEHDGPSVFAVFDGMGGEERGEMASLIAAGCAAGLKIGSEPIDDLQRYCAKANEEILKYAVDNNVGTMGTTAVLMVFGEKEIFLFNIGDSKAFRFDQEKLEQISVDDYAEISYRKKPPLSQNLGIPVSELMLEPHFAKGSYHDGDIFLLCSDGLTDMVSVEEIRKILTEETAGKAAERDTGNAADRGIGNAADRLLHKALENGGSDNITIILCRVKKMRGVLSRLFHSVFG